MVITSSKSTVVRDKIFESDSPKEEYCKEQKEETNSIKEFDISTDRYKRSLAKIDTSG